MQNSKNKKFSILIVDDTPSNIKFLGTLLVENNYEAEFALDGEEAIEWLKNRDFDLILLDIMMPKMDGFETCRRIKELNGKAEIPIIFLTAKVSPEDIIKGFETGAVDYITKPFNSTELLLRINTHIQLQYQKKQLLESNNTKDKFLSIIAHDLMNPMSAILSFTEFLEQSLASGDFELSETYRKYLFESAKNSFDLLNNLLSWGRIQSGKFIFNPIEFEFSDLIKEVYNTVLAQAIGKNIVIQLPDNQIHYVYADFNMISTVLRNLVSNAIKFSYPNSTIRITTNQINGHFACCVEDSGIGLSADRIAGLFKVHTNKSTSGTNNELGTGLGLLLVKEFIDVHLGEISVDSVIGKGSKFTFTIPITQSKDNLS